MSTLYEIVISQLDFQPDPQSSLDPRSSVDPHSLAKIPDDSEVAALRERLVQIAVAGKSKEYFEKSVSSDEIEKLDQKELQKLYFKSRYEIIEKTFHHGIHKYCQSVSP